jgi:hypothetical protein
MGRPDGRAYNKAEGRRLGLTPWPRPLVLIASLHRRLGDVLLDLVGRNDLAREQVE